MGLSRLCERIRVGLGWRWRHAAHRAATATTSVQVRLMSALQSAREWAQPNRLVILDDLFPNLASGFRTAEYNYLLDVFPTAEVLTTNDQVTFAGAAGGFRDAVAKYDAVHPGRAHRIRRLWPPARLSAQGAYTLFLYFTWRHIDLIERQPGGFVFTLYPGSYFRLDDAESNARLRRVLTSQALRGVITTQKVSHRYVLDRQYCRPDLVHLIQGVVVDPADVTDRPVPRSTPAEKGVFNVAFVAHKYMPGGVDKGYDTFVAMACRVAERRPDTRFHVVGNFDPDDVPLGSVANRLTFHGVQPSSWLASFFCGVDMIVSPNVPFQLAPGAFDGFPTGSCVQAALAGVPVVCTDLLNENTMFRDGEEIVIIPPDATAIGEVVLSLLDNPDRLARIGAAGRRAFKAAYSVENQLVPRAELLRTTFGLT